MNSTSAADVIIHALCPGPDVDASAPPSAVGAPLVTYASRFATRCSSVGAGFGGSSADAGAEARIARSARRIGAASATIGNLLDRMRETLPRTMFLTDCRPVDGVVFGAICPATSLHFRGRARRPCAPKKAKAASRDAAFLKNPGGVLLSHRVAPAVPSALESLTSVFGMGTGVASPALPPGKTIEVRGM